MNPLFSYFLKPVKPLTAGLRLAVISVAKYGIGIFPQARLFFEISLHWQNPGAAPSLIRGVPGNDYLLTNAWAAILAGMIGISDLLIFYLFQFGLVVAALLIPFVMQSLSSSPDRLWLLVLLLLGGPQCAVLLNWVGGYDALSVIGAFIAVLASSSSVSAMGWVILALNHPSLATVSWLLWLPLRFWFNGGVGVRIRLKQVIPSILSIAVGMLINYLIALSWGGNTSRIDWLVHWDYGAYVVNYLNALPIILWSILGLGWLILVGTSLIKLPETKILLLTITLAGVLLPLVAVDETRVVSLALLPVLLTYVRYVDIPGNIWLLEAGRGWFALVAILLPTVLVFSRTESLNGWAWIWRLI